MLDQRIAIVGMGGLFPSAPTPARLWAHVLAAADTARRVPPGRWLLDPDEAFDPAIPAPDKVYSLRGCFLDDIPLDAAGLDLSPDLLARLDPVFHLTLHAGRQAFESGVTGTLDRRRVGVILGNIVLPTEAASRLAFDYLGRTFAEQVRRAGRALPPLSPAGRGVGGEGSLYGPALPAALLARALGLGGGSHTLDAACASSLYALKLAVEELRAGRADAMLAGGVSRPDCLYTQMGFSQLRALSPSGRASPFDARADGLVVGEGAGVFLLKRLQDARRDGDRILAVIAGIGLSNDVGGSLLAPGSEGQLRAMHAAYREAGWSPHDIDLIECHATGTPVGDAVEFQSLRSLWGAGGWQPGQCIIGSVKSTVGHLLTAAGAAGLSKVLSAFAAQTLPPTANFATPARGIDLDASPFQILTTPRPWPRRGETTPRRAAVSAFGFGGINAHLLLEEYFPAPASARSGEQERPPPAPVAVVGMAAHFGPWRSLRALRQRLLGRDEDLEPTPPRHWWGVEDSDWFRQQGLDAAAFAGYYLDDLSVPLDRFRIPPRELQETLPQQLLMLRVAADALAGLELDDALRLRTGVFIGLGLDLNTTNFHLRWSLRDPAPRDAAGPPLTANRTMGALGSIAASRIAREFHLGGPSFTISSEETSGLRALEAAVRALQRGDIDRAVVGAVDLAGDVRAVLAAGAGRPYTPGEGAAAVVLRRLEDVQATDTVHAVIKGIGASAADACREAGIEPDSVAHVQTDDDVRARIGHAGAATGLASLVTACLSPDGPRRALVHSAGAGGDCVHVVLEARGPTAITPPPQSTGRTLTVPVGGRPFVIPPLPIPPGEPVGWAESSRPTGGTETKGSVQPQVSLALGEDRFSIPRTPPGRPPDRETNSPESQEQWRPAFAPVRAPTHPTDLPATETNARAQFGRRGSGVFYPPVGLEDSAHPTLGSQIAAVATTEDARGRAHSAYLRLSQAVNRTLSDNLAFQTVLLEALLSRGHAPATAAPLLDRPRCLEFAVGSIARVLGPEYAEVDTFPTRVRLPDEPLMLVDRVLHVEGQPRSLGPGRVVTEHDIHPGAWYLDGGRIPTCIAIEAGQADLFLSAYLGIDFHTRGRAVYRLLDAAVTFHRGLPGPGETIRYDIHIDRFFRQGDTHLFRFRFEGTVRGEPLLTMTGGCAGFFTAADLAAGKGVVLTELAQRPRPGVQPDDNRELAPMAVESYSAEQVDALRTGDLAACFGPTFAGLRLAPSLQLPGGRMQLVHRVTHLDPAGGRFGIGLIRAEADVRPDAWFLTCHFVDDQVMPGTLMYECCLHTLRIYLLRRGWVAADGAVFEPVPGVAGRLRCRGQVTASTRTVTYEVILKERGYRPEPYALADALMYADGKLIVEITDMALQLSGASRESVTAVWRDRGGSAKQWVHDPRGTGLLTRSDGSGEPSHRAVETASKPQGGALFTREQIVAFAVGKPSEAFGEPYRVFDQERFIARLPGPPYLFLDRVTRIEAEPWKLAPGAVAETEYDVPPDAWYFEADRQRTLPFAVLLEVPLQSCGWLAAYMGSALTSPEDLCFRNLGGKADLLAPVRAGDGTLTTRVRVTAVTRSAGMIIQSFEFETRTAARPVYRGSTTFGFFSRAALAQQVGIRDARPYRPDPAEQARARSFDYPRRPPFPDDRWRMVDRVETFIPDGGPHGLGFIEAGKDVDPAAWFFEAHFYQDPVWPGSLGLESLIQLMKVVAAERWPEAAGQGRFLPMLGRTHEWTYRGQVLPTSGKVQVQAVITACHDESRTLTADGFLRADGRVIYQMRDFALTVDSSR